MDGRTVALADDAPGLTAVVPGSSVALEHLSAAATLVPRPEAVRTASRLANREVGNRPRRRRLPFRPWKRRANQRAVNRTFVPVVVAFLDVAFNLLDSVGCVRLHVFARGRNECLLARSLGRGRNGIGNDGDAGSSHGLVRLVKRRFWRTDCDARKQRAGRLRLL